MKWVVWIPLSNGGRSRYGAYECYEEAHRTAVYFNGVVEHGAIAMGITDPTEQQLRQYQQQIQRALSVLQNAQRYGLANYSMGAVMEHCTRGDYVGVDDVVKTIQILQEKL